MRWPHTLGIGLQLIEKKGQVVVQILRAGGTVAAGWRRILLFSYGVSESEYH